MAKHNEIGKIGENIAKTFLMKHGFHVLDANYRTKYGEIDIIAQKDNVLRFVEVKSVTVQDFEAIRLLHVKPEDHLTRDKWRKIVTSTQIYLRGRGLPPHTKHQIDLACVYIQTEKREGKVILMENIYKE